MFRKFLGRSQGFAPGTPPLELESSENEGVWKILHTGPNPTTDYYIKPEIANLGCTCEMELLSASPQQFRRLNKLIIVRYLTEDWAEWLNAHRAWFSEIVYFMDDQLLDPTTWGSLPANYRERLMKNFAVLRKWLPKLATQYWVSTERLRDSNTKLVPRVISPRPLPGDAALRNRMADASRKKLVFYHATASHYDEFVWLKPLIANVLHKHSSVHFELIGDIQVNRMFRDLPRTRILHPMSWENYLSYTSSVSGGLGLAPLLASPFNAARSTVKQLDVDRMSARGLYTENSAYTSGSDPKRSYFATNTYQEWEREIDTWLQDMS